MPWQATLGAVTDDRGTHFRIWAPKPRALELLLRRPDGVETTLRPTHDAGGIWYVFAEGVGAGARYRYRVDGQGPFPDPASRYQPEGVHGPSEVVDPRRFRWSTGWSNRPYEELVVYELHVGTFTPEGTFGAVIERLPYLAELGVTAIELMPVADFPGRRNWGYDGVCPFAPARCYGTPDDLRRLVDAAHGHGLAVLLDVVYNHFGPDGNYTGVYSQTYSAQRPDTPWGAALRFEEEPVRRYFLENALHWLHEYHLDGFRLDATHHIHDDSPQHFLIELARTLRASVPGRPLHLIAEDGRNLADLLRPAAQGGWDYDGVWADDFHHELRRFLAGDHEGYYADYAGRLDHVATALNRGWLYCGEFSKYLDKPRGTDPAGLPPRAFVFCLQNHDQVGNRALGERLHHQIDPAVYRAASALLLAMPQTPMLFMGQEWAAGSPFLFFTDHNAELGRLVTEGRRQEFRHFAAFTDPAARQRIPDPQADATFGASKLRWAEQESEPHAGLLRLYRELLRLRRSEPALRDANPGHFRAEAVGDETIILRRRPRQGPALTLICRLRGSGAVPWEGGKGWEVALTTEEVQFTADGRPPRLAGSVVEFARPGAVLLREV